MIDNQAGYVKCKEVQADVVSVFSKNGEVVVKPANEKGEMNIETETGDIRVTYGNEPSNLKVKVENAKGDTSVNLGGLSTANGTDQDVNGTIGAGENSLHVKSRSGTIEVK
ncbi:MAG: DUF4097 family beta strand repeat-containing protein [Sphingobacterium sp.]|jgi:DUF4097 and DUF4098 domain-containing protein YvlB|nr:DUF4097 family beta strand repeat-containing protein [Sphingobacterium sp.]